VDHRDHVVFEHFTGTQAWHGNVLLAVVGVNRCFTFHGSSQVLNCVVSRLYYAAIGLDHADVTNLHPFVGGVVADLNLPPLLHSGFALHPDAGNRFPAACAIAFEAVGRAVLFDDKPFLRIVAFGHFRLGSSRIRRLCIVDLRTFLGFRRKGGTRGRLARLCGGRERHRQCARDEKWQKETTHTLIVRPGAFVAKGYEIPGSASV